MAKDEEIDNDDQKFKTVTNNDLVDTLQASKNFVEKEKKKSKDKLSSFLNNGSGTLSSNSKDLIFSNLTKVGDAFSSINKTRDDDLYQNHNENDINQIDTNSGMVYNSTDDRTNNQINKLLDSIRGKVDFKNSSVSSYRYVYEQVMEFQHALSKKVNDIINTNLLSSNSPYGDIYKPLDLSATSSSQKKAQINDIINRDISKALSLVKRLENILTETMITGSYGFVIHSVSDLIEIHNKTIKKYNIESIEDRDSIFAAENYLFKRDTNNYHNASSEAFSDKTYFIENDPKASGENFARLNNKKSICKIIGSENYDKLLFNYKKSVFNNLKSDYRMNPNPNDFSTKLMYSINDAFSENCQKETLELNYDVTDGKGEVVKKVNDKIKNINRTIEDQFNDFIYNLDQNLIFTELKHTLLKGVDPTKHLAFKNKSKYIKDKNYDGSFAYNVDVDSKLDTKISDFVNGKIEEPKLSFNDKVNKKKKDSQKNLLMNTLNKGELDDVIIKELTSECIYPIIYNRIIMGYIIYQQNPIGNDVMTKERNNTGDGFASLFSNYGLNNDKNLHMGDPSVGISHMGFGSAMGSSTSGRAVGTATAGSLYNNFLENDSNRGLIQDSMFLKDNHKILINIIEKMLKKKMDQCNNGEFELDPKLKNTISNIFYDSIITNAKIDMTFVPVDRMCYLHNNTDGEGYPISILKDSLSTAYEYLCFKLVNVQLNLNKTTPRQTLKFKLDKGIEPWRQIHIIQNGIHGFEGFSLGSAMTNGDTTEGALYKGIHRIGAGSMNIIPVSPEGNDFFEVSDMERLTADDVPQDALDKKLATLLVKTGVPLETIRGDYNLETATQMILTSTRYLYDIMRNQANYSEQITDFIKLYLRTRGYDKLYDIDIEKEIVFTFPKPNKLLSEMALEEINSLRSTAETFADIFLPVGHDVQKKYFVKHYIEKFCKIDYEDIKEIINLVNGDKTILADMINANKFDDYDAKARENPAADDDGGGDYGSDDSGDEGADEDGGFDDGGFMDEDGGGDESGGEDDFSSDDSGDDDSGGEDDTTWDEQ